MNDFVIPELYGIVGYPLGHSLSPLLHNISFRELGLPGVFTAWPVRADDLPAFVQAVRLLGIRGCSVTMPHKEAIMPLLDVVTERAGGVGSVNTLFWGGDRLCGENTDVLGFMEPLRQAEFRPGACALVLGAGGAARAAVAGLRALGVSDIRIAARRGEQSEKLAAAFGVGTAEWTMRGEAPAWLVVNTTSLGMKGAREDETPFAAEWFGHEPGIAYDAVYAPFETRFLREAAAAGWRTIGGVEMFLGQARHQCRIWTGRELPKAAELATLDVLKTRE